MAGSIIDASRPWRAMTKTGNVLQVLRLFSEERQQVRVADIARLLKVSNATAYRYVSDLERAGLVESSSTGQYVLGPTIVELDRQIRIHDPLIAAAADILRTLSERTGGTTILARSHGRKVVCVDQVPGRHGPKTVSYERGRAMPLYRGATSTVILAHLNRETIRALASEDAAALKKAGLPSRPDALLEYLELLRAQGVVRTEGAVDAEAVGWATPIHHGKHLLGSMSVVLSRNAPDVAPQRVADQLRRAALRVQGRLDAARERD
jgi:DNA-binding IclR family transcriptional regulator